MNISIANEWRFMTCLAVIDNIHMKGTVSQIIDIGSRFDFITKNGKLVIIFFLEFILHFIK